MLMTTSTESINRRATLDPGRQNEYDPLVPGHEQITEDHPDGSVSDERVCASSDIFFVSRHEDQQ